MKKFVTELPHPSHEIETPLGQARDKLVRTVVDYTKSEAPSSKIFVQTIKRLFDNDVAIAIQTRETDYVNTMTQVFQDEMKRKKEEVENFKQMLTKTKAKNATLDSEMEQLKQQLDRRRNESDNERKKFYKQVLMLREMVTNHKTDHATLEAIDRALVLHHNLPENHQTAPVFEDKEGPTTTISRRTSISQAVRQMGKFPITETGSSASEDHVAIGLLKSEIKMRKKIQTSMKHEKNKWEQRAKDSFSELGNLRQNLLDLQTKNEALSQKLQSTSWWKHSSAGGIQEFSSILNAIEQGETTWDSVAEAVVEIVAHDDLWSLLTARCASEASIQEKKPASHKTWKKLRSHIAELNHKHDLETRNARKRASIHMAICKACRGIGMVTIGTSEYESDSHLKKALARVHELKTDMTMLNEKLAAEKAETNQLKEHVRILQAEIVRLQPEPLKIETTSSQTILFGDFQKKDPRVHDLTVTCAKLEKEYSQLSKDFENQAQELQDTKNELDSKLQTIDFLNNSILDHADQLKGLTDAAEARERILNEEAQNLREKLNDIQTKSKKAIEDRHIVLKRRVAAQFVRMSSLSIPESDEKDSEEIKQVIADAIAAKNDDEAVKDELSELKQHENTAEEDKITEISDQTSRQEMRNIVAQLKSRLALQEQEIRSSRRAQVTRVSTVSGNLAHVAVKLAMVKKKSEAEVGLWRSECEKLEHEVESLKQSLEAKNVQSNLALESVKTTNVLQSFCKQLNQFKTESKPVDEQMVYVVPNGPDDALDRLSSTIALVVAENSPYLLQFNSLLNFLRLVIHDFQVKQVNSTLATVASSPSPSKKKSRKQIRKQKSLNRGPRNEKQKLTREKSLNYRNSEPDLLETNVNRVKIEAIDNSSSVPEERVSLSRWEESNTGIKEENNFESTNEVKSCFPEYSVETHPVSRNIESLEEDKSVPVIEGKNNEERIDTPVNEIEKPVVWETDPMIEEKNNEERINTSVNEIEKHVVWDIDPMIEEKSNEERIDTSVNKIEKPAVWDIDPEILSEIETLMQQKRQLDQSLVGSRWKLLVACMRHRFDLERLDEMQNESKTFKMEFPQELLRVEWLKTVELMRKLSQESAGKSQSLRAERRNHSRQRTAVVNQIMGVASRLLSGPETEIRMNLPSRPAIACPEMSPAIVDMGNLPPSQRIPTRHFQCTDDSPSTFQIHEQIRARSTMRHVITRAHLASRHEDQINNIENALQVVPLTPKPEVEELEVAPSLLSDVFHLPTAVEVEKKNPLIFFDVDAPLPRPNRPRTTPYHASRFSNSPRTRITKESQAKLEVRSVPLPNNEEN